MPEKADCGMEMVALIVILVVLIAMFGYVAYLYMKEAGNNGVQLWLTGSQRIRQSMTAAQRSLQTQATGPIAEEADVVSTPGASRQLSAREMMMSIDDETIRQLKEEFQSELRLAVGRSREFDARLTRIEATADDGPSMSDRINRELGSVREQQQAEIARLQDKLESVKERVGSYGERRGQALADLYGNLARVEASLAAVVNPMLLPGEPLTVPHELPAEAMVWNNWGDVGERAFGFGNVFNENRLMLDPATADGIEKFIATLRQGLTGSVYPNVRAAKPSADQIAQMRLGLQAIVAELPAVRRQIEDAYRGDPG
jgi:flagellar biosynthesis regulator FlbT